MNMAVIDASDHIVGRLSSVVAKRLLRGEEIHIVNAERAIVTGRRGQIMEDYSHRRERGQRIMKIHGPKYPRRPDRILKRTVRGMLPYQRPRGRDAFRKLRVYIGVPEEFKGQGLETIPEAQSTGSPRFVRLGDISKVLGFEV